MYADMCILNCFNSRPRVGGDNHEHLKQRPTLCFNSRPRVGGDKYNMGRKDYDDVSTHAPV